MRHRAPRRLGYEPYTKIPKNPNPVEFSGHIIHKSLSSNCKIQLISIIYMTIAVKTPLIGLAILSFEDFMKVITDKRKDVTQDRNLDPALAWDDIT